MGKRKRRPHPPVAIVEWHDSRTLTAKWADRRLTLAEAKPLYHEAVVSVGFVLKQGGGYIVLALGLSGNDDVMHVLQIPTENIVWSRILRKGRGYKLVKPSKDR